MKIEAIYKRTINLLINPRAEWEVIKQENQTHSEIFKGFGIPLIILLSACSVIGNAFYASRILFSLPYLIFNGIAMFLIGTVGTLLSIKIINEITTSFNTKKDINLTSKLVIYSLTSYTIFMSIAFILPSPFYQIRLFGLYSIVLYWIGSGIISETPTDNKVGFVFISNLTILGVFFILSTIFSIILKGIFGLSLILK
jgi:hypothetical protein